MKFKEPLSFFTGLFIGLLGYELLIYFVNPYEAAWLSIFIRVVVVSMLATLLMRLFKGKNFSSIGKKYKNKIERNRYGETI